MKEDHKEEAGNENEDQYEKDMKLSNMGKRKKQIDEDLVVATALVLLVAGYDTTGITLSYLSYQLSKDEEVQTRLQEEIDQAFEEAGGKFPDYNVIQSLPYLDMVIHETLRFYPPVGPTSGTARRITSCLTPTSTSRKETGSVTTLGPFTQTPNIGATRMSFTPSTSQRRKKPTEILTPSKHLA